jgi:hypothetical protein
MRTLPLLILTIIILTSCNQKTKDLPKNFEEAKGILLQCKNYRLADKTEWENKGHIVQNNIAISNQPAIVDNQNLSKLEFDITKEKLCMDNLGKRCKEACKIDYFPLILIDKDKFKCLCDLR